METGRIKAMSTDITEGKIKKRLVTFVHNKDKFIDTVRSILK